MSSPLANKTTSHFKKNIIRFHHQYSHNNRVRILSEKIVEVVQTIGIYDDNLKVLDFGCGDMKISSYINQIITNSSFIGADIHELPSNVSLPFEYIKYNGQKLPFNDNYFDLVILIDVLHHISEKLRDNIIRECSRVGKKVIVKDHFEKGFFSRAVLTIMDLLGNWAYGVKVYNNYFNKESFSEFCKKNNLEYEIIIPEISIYDHLPSLVKYIAPNDLHFIAVLQKQ